MVWFAAAQRCCCSALALGAVATTTATTTSRTTTIAYLGRFPGKLRRCATTSTTVTARNAQPLPLDEGRPSPPSSSPQQHYHQRFYKIYYNDVYQVDLPPKHRFPMNKYQQVRTLVQDRIQGLPREQKDKVECEFLVSPLATLDELATTHSLEYIQRFLQGDQTPEEQRNVGFPWSQQGVDRALSSVGGALAATLDVCQIRKEQQQQQQQQQGATTTKEFPAPWGAHIAGGTHHAFYDRGEGFSVFSDIAVAANLALQTYPEMVQKVLILDLDVHQGNGNAVLFQKDPRVVTVSLHCEANYFSQKETSDLDIELPAGCKDSTYLATLHHWLNRIHKEAGDSLDLVFFQAGVDILEDDRLGRMDISRTGIQRRNQLVYEFVDKLNLPLVICMGGGYPRGEDWTPIIDAHADVYSQAHSFLSDSIKDGVQQKAELETP